MEKAKFSPGGEFLSVSGSDGRLRIWETKDKSITSLKQEFVPSAHLSATCTCLEWAPSSSSSNAKINGDKNNRKKKKRSFEGDLVAMGTADGSLLFYSVAKSSLLAHSKQGHSGPVTGLAWSPISLSLFSCGEDGFIVEWDAENARSVSRWKGGKGSLSCLCIFNNSLLSAGRGITLWDLETKTSIQNFMGQPSTVCQMQTIPNTDYFVTMSLTEMHLQIWSKSEQSAVATLMLYENPRHFCVLSSTSDGRVSVAAVTENGNLCTFNHKLNGPLRKPLAPNCVLTVLDTDESSAQVPVLSCFMSSSSGEDESSAEVKLAYGSWLRLRFESMSLKFLQDKITIKREFALKTKVSSKHNNKTKAINNANADNNITEIPSDAKHLQPGAESGSNSKLEGKGKKRKKNEDPNSKEDEGELPMEDRLSNLTIDASSSGAIPDGNNLAHLLSQGLHSKDVKILQSVLSRWDQDVIENTVRSLPVQLIVPLLNEVKKMLANKPMLNHSVIKWLKAIFKVHSAFLMSCPSSEDLLGPFMSLLHSREILYPQMCQLKGKLELIKGNIESKEHKTEIPNEALLVYHDESSDEGEDDDMIPSESEEFIGSDDLIEDDDDDDESDDSDSAAGSEKMEGSSSSSDSDQESDGENDKKIATTKKSKIPISKMNGGGSHDESSMDDDDDE